MTDNTDVWSMTPEQAAAQLNEMATAYRATQPADPQAELNKAYADPKFQEKLNAGSPEARAEFDRLVAAAADQNPVAAAMSGTLPDVPSSEQRLMASTASWLGEMEMPGAVIEQALSGRPVSQAEFDLVRAHREKLLNNAEWTKRLLAGDLEARQQLVAMNIVIANGAEEKAA